MICLLVAQKKKIAAFLFMLMYLQVVIPGRLHASPVVKEVIPVIASSLSRSAPIANQTHMNIPSAAKNMSLAAKKAISQTNIPEVNKTASKKFVGGPGQPEMQSFQS